MGRSDIEECDRSQVNECSNIRHKINQNLKHVSVIMCISAAGESLTPYIMTSQDLLPARENLKKRDARFGTDFSLKAHSKPYTNAEFFLEYICTVFFPNLNELPALQEFADEDGVLLMDNCPSHVTDEVLGLLRDARVRVIIWSIHTTQIFQQLDFSFLEF
jgi:hypothetical protein